jgi:hypothetical protein
VNAYVGLLVMGSAIWVGIDASNLGMQRGRIGGGTLDMGVASWVLATLLIWIVGFPCYLIARGRYVAMRQPVVWGAQPQVYGLAPPQYSPDGRWWWDGGKWVATAQPAPVQQQPDQGYFS